MTEKKNSTLNTCICCQCSWRALVYKDTLVVLPKASIHRNNLKHKAIQTQNSTTRPHHTTEKYRNIFFFGSKWWWTRSDNRRTHWKWQKMCRMRNLYWAANQTNGSGFEIVMYHDNGETFSVCHGREAKCAYSFIIQITVSVWIQNK